MSPGRALELQRRAMAIAAAFRPTVSRQAERERAEGTRGRRNVPAGQIDAPERSTLSEDSAARRLAVIMGRGPRRALGSA